MEIGKGKEKELRERDSRGEMERIKGSGRKKIKEGQMGAGFTEYSCTLPVYPPYLYILNS